MSGNNKVFCFAVGAIVLAWLGLSASVIAALNQANLEFKQEEAKEEAIKERRHQDMLKAIRDKNE